MRIVPAERNTPAPSAAPIATEETPSSMDFVYRSTGGCPRPPWMLPRIVSGPTQKRRELDRKSTRLNSSHTVISYAVFCLKKKKVNFSHNLPQKNNRH